ncbi:MAG: alpha/beta hydrolase [Candidatus Bathyarchaeota archaeon]|nr:alpha/beta hydrolase [Candidatus Bathyarchaeota archaeon]
MAKYENVEFTSGGNKLLGRVYRPDGRARRPAVAICHGYPGDTKNMDLAEELALNGVVTLVFYYQGAWGSGGKYSLTKLETGAKDAVAYLRTLTYVDPKRVGLVSHSMGALPLSKTMSIDPTIKTGVLMSPASDTRAMASKVEENAKRLAAMAEGKLTGVTYESMMKDLGEVSKATNPVELVKKIKAPIMVVVGSKDNVTPPEACKRVYDAANEPKKWVLIEGADHGFSEHRIPLIRAVLGSLKETL